MMDANEEVFNPFPGLRPFETDEYHLFFGREGQSDELMARLQRTRFLAVVGTSGSGKSSLIRAGLLPSLYGGLMAGVGSGWRVALMRPGHDPLGNLACELGTEGVLGAEGGDAELQNALIETTLRRSTLGLVDVTRQARLGEHENLLVVVDQFEELFRFRGLRETRGTEDEAAAFVKLLLEAAQQREVSVYVVLTMRSDFLGDCAQFWGLPEAINEGQYLIPRMTRDERREAITGPVAVGGGEIAKSLVNRLLNDMGDSPDQLPILQHALMRTWDEWRDQSPEHRARHADGGAIDLCCYEAIGGMSDALSRHADEAWGELRGERERAICEKLFKALTEKVGDDREIRRPTRLREICGAAEATPEEVVAVIDVFRREGRSFLMPPAGVELEPDTVIDISHESLIRNWARLKKWTSEEAQSTRFYTRIADAAAMHAEGQGGYMSDPALQLMLDWREQTRPNAAWATRHPVDFASAMSFLDASREHRDAQLAAERVREQREIEQTRAFAEQQARSNRKLRLLMGALAVLLLLSLGTAGYALAKRSEAHANEAEAVRLAALARENEKAAIKQREEVKAVLAEKVKEEELRKVAEFGEEKARAAEEEALAKALRAKTRAETEAARANQQARIAAQNVIAAKLAEKAANEAAEAKVAALERNRWSRDGLAAYQRGDYAAALNAFQIVRDGTATKGQIIDGEIKDREMARVHGWSFANIGATQRQLDQHSDAVKSYEHALKILEEVLDPDDPFRFDTYHGLAHAYHDNYQMDQAEQFYKKALEFLDPDSGKSSPSTPSPNKPSQVVAVLENIARLYRDLGRHAEAEPIYNRIISIREADESDTRALVAALKEVAQFYVGQNKYKEAEALYPKILDEQEKIFIEGEGSGGDERASFRDLGDSYSELGEVYVGLNEEQKAKDAFQMSRVIQDYWIKSRQVIRANPVADAEGFMKTFKEVGGDKSLAEMAELSVALGRYKAAEGVYLTLIRFQERAGEDAASARTHLALGNLYRDRLDKPEEAMKQYNEVEEDANRSGQTGLLADAYREIAALLAKDPNKTPDAEAYYARALEIYATSGDWMKENVVTYALVQLHLKNRPELEKSVKRRLDTLTRYFKRLGDASAPQPKSPVLLVSEYLSAASDATTFYRVWKKEDEALAVYREAAASSDYIMRNIYNGRILDAYAKLLDKYSGVLDKRGARAEAVQAAASAKAVRDRQHQLDQVREQQNVQQTY